MAGLRPLYPKYFQKFMILGSCVSSQNSSVFLNGFLPCDIPLCTMQKRCKTTQKIHKATKKGRLILADQKRLKELEEFKDPKKQVLGLLKKAGIKPGKPAEKRPITLTCTADVVEPYIPPEGDGKASLLSPEGARQKADRVKNIGAARLAQRKIHKYEPEFSTSEFAWKAQSIFIDVHKNLVDFDEDKLHTLVTEKCYPEITKSLKLKTLRWKFVESIDKPRVVHMRVTELLNKSNVFGQVTVRMHTKQTIAIYDQFGRLMMGSEDVPKDVLEYIVFEKFLASGLSSWRLHGKIVPDWAEHMEPLIPTRVLPQSTTTQDLQVMEEEKDELRVS